MLSFQAFQEDLEQEQVKVNSLTHMVVVVDENSGDRATAALEEQLQVMTEWQCQSQKIEIGNFLNRQHQTVHCVQDHNL